MSNRRTSFVSFRAMGAIALVAVALGACRDGEQNRARNFEPGVFKGNQEAPLAADTMRDLKVRAMMQGNRFAMSGGGGGRPTASADVRKPSLGLGAGIANRMRGQAN